MQHPKNSYYPEYNVVDQFHEWDKVTQHVVKTRLAAFHVEFFTPEEQELLVALFPIFFPSHLGDIGINCLSILDERCRQEKIQTYARGTSLLTKDVIRKGLKAIHLECFTQFHQPFSKLENKLQHSYIDSIKQNISTKDMWQDFSPALFVKTFSCEMIKIIYSDPSVWSKIGYGGPSYPRGYYAFGFKQFDSWEAPLYEKKRDG
ncbi:gluconate 2-dehydrogenase subunit 3 family protein [Sutcliffiella halmapala]|uniref:gluconate 2-dehydrogenase subunit 3 family protein n=1 Tax=Sutcliffiella halmapala TaxID=79882 RepID=UPI0009957F0A|nr:gluconate 2-dehydrogenase subunit 3 family protein [Sutcliffiella halmapala]